MMFLCHHNAIATIPVRRRIVSFGAVLLMAAICCTIQAVSAWTPRHYILPKTTGRQRTKATTTPLCAKRGQSSKAASGGDDVVALLHSHHLLNHKPDNLLLKGGKYKLRGVACLGRPGMALCIGPEKAVARFRGALESAMPQKRFKTKVLPVPSSGCGDIEAFGSATPGKFREVLASIDQEDEFFALTGIQNPNESSSSSSSSSSGTGAGNQNGNNRGNVDAKSGGGKKKRKRK